ncbi:hypothetical protein SAMN05216360_103102 [Methylobacterium phyllostachyos]|uniref:Uncharacterized protein n=1 Tax=Methylobacterium phyllostachyos TaxID=582672 RepID=A0A1G9V8A1_9HYPH|nr:hypothetical protein [Methylobacterium phyllostachyos]SDM68379.1 hypothetical protein SAMN05216360_103102 [Methylobacterium phyllostachyos]
MTQPHTPAPQTSWVLAGVVENAEPMPAPSAPAEPFNPLAGLDTSGLFDGDALSDGLDAVLRRHSYRAVCMTAPQGSAIHSLLVQAMNAGDCIETIVDAREGNVLAAARQAAGGIAGYLTDIMRTGQAMHATDMVSVTVAMNDRRPLIAIRHQERAEYAWLMSPAFWSLLAAQVPYWGTLDLDRPCGGLFDEEWTHVVSHRDACEALFFDISVA